MRLCLSRLVFLSTNCTLRAHCAAVPPVTWHGQPRRPPLRTRFKFLTSQAGINSTELKLNETVSTLYNLLFHIYFTITIFLITAL